MKILEQKFGIVNYFTMDQLSRMSINKKESRSKTCICQIEYRYTLPTLYKK